MVEDYKKILELILQDKTNEEISIELNYSKSTVKRRIKELFELYKVKSRFQLGREYMKERYN